jgi:hypothetical protein
MDAVTALATSEMQSWHADASLGFEILDHIDQGELWI